MSEHTVHEIVGVILIAHGLGHVLAILAGFGVSLSKSHSLHSWALSPLFGEKGTVIIGILLHAAAIACFIIAGLGLFHRFITHEEWSTYASAASILSLAGLVLFWNAYPFFIPNKVGVILVDAFILLSIYLTHWPSQLY